MVRETQKKILIVEDDPASARLVEHTLEREGYQVDTARNGVEGLRQAMEGEPDLVILDVMLPGLDGFELCHRLRADPKTYQLPIIMLSAKAQDIDKDTSLKVGANLYLLKPAEPAEIRSQVKSLLAGQTVLAAP